LELFLEFDRETFTANGGAAFGQERFELLHGDPAHRTLGHGDLLSASLYQTRVRKASGGKRWK
jgi:hypothetical protein